MTNPQRKRATTSREVCKNFVVLMGRKEYLYVLNLSAVQPTRWKEIGPGRCS